jgi:hypothetical protein
MPEETKETHPKSAQCSSERFQNHAGGSRHWHSGLIVKNQTSNSMVVKVDGVKIKGAKI